LPQIKFTFWKSLTLITLAALASLVAQGNVHAGEIAGLRPQLPTFLQRDLDATFVNDFLGRGGSVDDYRTQQSVISAALADRWIAILDHSILTLTDEPSPGRIDQRSVSLGYKLISHHLDGHADSLIVGTGLRSVGEFSGERIQNGFHRIVGSSIEELAYTRNTGTDITAWFDAERYRMLRDSRNEGLFKTWRVGYQIRAASLATSGGQWDSTIGIQAVISKPVIDIWLGVRSDWRSGYDEPVLRETASAEDDVAAVLGARIGPLIFETVQQFNNKASYGQIRLVSSADDTRKHRLPRMGLDLGVMLPDVMLRLAGRLRARILTAAASRWNESLVIGLGYGQPQYKDNTELSTDSWQADVGIELERPFSGDTDWLSLYGSMGLGWRDETLIRDGDLQDESSESIGHAVLSASAGLRFDLSSPLDRWRFRLQFGLVGRLPIDDAEVRIADQLFRIQRSALDLMIGAAFDFE
jgi:hypothetical protein